MPQRMTAVQRTAWDAAPLAGRLRPGEPLCAAIASRCRAPAVQWARVPHMNGHPDPQDGGSEVIAAQSVFPVRAQCSPTCGSFSARHGVWSPDGPRGSRRIQAVDAHVSTRLFTIGLTLKCQSRMTVRSSSLTRRARPRGREFRILRRRAVDPGRPRLVPDRGCLATVASPNP